MATAHNDLDDTLRQFKEDLTHRIYMQSSSLRKVRRGKREDDDERKTCQQRRLVLTLYLPHLGSTSLQRFHCSRCSVCTCACARVYMGLRRVRGGESYHHPDTATTSFTLTPHAHPLPLRLLLHHKVFRSLDKDASGSITRDELIVALRRFNVGGSDGPALVKQLVDECDPDGNGEIGFEEFAQMLRSTTRCPTRCTRGTTRGTRKRS